MEGQTLHSSPVNINIRDIPVPAVSSPFCPQYEIPT